MRSVIGTRKKQILVTLTVCHNYHVNVINPQLCVENKL